MTEGQDERMSSRRLGLDAHLDCLQYGFRKGKGTTEALHYVRRLLERGEGFQGEHCMVLLDWRQAFDKVCQKQLFVAMERMNVPPWVAFALA